TQRRLSGCSRDYIIDRLKRAGRTDFLDAIERGELSAHECAVSMGWIRRPPTLSHGNTPQARRRQLRFHSATGEGLSPDRMMELWLGPGAAGSYFHSREELEQAWRENRAEVMRQWGSHGRRPAGYYEFEWDGPRPPYAVERSTLWKVAGVLTE